MGCDGLCMCKEESEDTYTFSHKDSDMEVTVKVQAITIDELLEGVHSFIQACTFIPKGTLQYVDSDTVRDENAIISKELDRLEARELELELQLQQLQQDLAMHKRFLDEALDREVALAAQVRKYEEVSFG